MRIIKRTFTSAALAGAIATTLLIGCEKKGDAISSAEQTDKKAGVAAPGIAETKAIAEEGFIYGLPLVMNYAVMNEFAVDTKSSQFKAPFNEINNEHRVATPEDTAVITPNSDTPYSMVWMDLRAEPMVISVPAVEKERKAKSWEAFRASSIARVAKCFVLSIFELRLDRNLSSTRAGDCWCRMI